MRTIINWKVMLLISWMGIISQSGLGIGYRHMPVPLGIQDQTLQQEKKVTGKVTNQEGDPLVGVTVLEKGTTNGTVTDLDGKYSLEVSGVESKLVFSFVGMMTREVAVGNRTTLDIELEEKASELEEVVVVGYGTEKKVNLSGAVSQVDAEELESRPITNVSQGLQGLTPNLNINFMSGEPGEAADINIRGITSINEGEPLILIDGVPSDPVELNRLSPGDVEDISVLKDASSAAIYGARAAFGVVMITTKSGSQQGMEVGFTSNLSWDTPTILPDKIIDPYIYLRIRETSTDNTPWDNQNYSDQTYLWAKQRSEDPSTPAVRTNPNDETAWEYMGDRDWTHYFLDNYNLSQKYHLNLSGSSEKTSYYLSGSYNTQHGALKLSEDQFERYSARSKVDYTPFEWLRLGSNTVLTMTERSKPYHMSIWDLYNFHPTDWHKNPDGTWANTPVGRMGAQLTEGGKINSRYASFQTTFTGQASLWEDLLELNSDLTIRRGSDNYRSHQNKYNIGYGPGDIREEGTNNAYRSVTFDTYTVFNVYTTFNQTFGKHDLTAIAGFNQEYSRSEWFMAQKDKVISSSLPTIELATGEDRVGEYVAEWAVRGAFYRLNYTFDDKYIVELNGRWDGSSKFPEDDRFGFFPSASLAWRIDREPFWQGIKNTISMFKIRGSYGSLGNQFVQEYGYIPTMSAYTADYIIGGGRPQQVSAPPLVSPNYTWEHVTTQNLGVDLGLFDNRLTAIFDIYRRDTEGMLTQGKDLPNVLGASEPNENAADLKTVGWELTLNYKNRLNVGNNPLSFDLKFVLSDSRSWITGFDNPNKNLTQYYKGQELGEIWGLQSNGFFGSQEEIAQLDQSQVIPWGALAIVPGWPRYEDLDGNGVIEKGTTVDNPKDLSVIGNVTPRYNYGFNFNMRWKGLDIRAFVQGVGQKDYYPLDYLYWGFYQQPYAGGYEHLTDFYRGSADSQVDLSKHSQAYIDAGLADANKDAQYPIMQAWLADRNLGERIDQSKGLAIPQTRYLLDGSYLRLKNLTIGYTLPQKVTQSINVSKLRVFFSGENLGELSELTTYFDPEAINDAQKLKTNPSANPGRTSGKGYAYPFQRRYSIGVNMTF